MYEIMVSSELGLLYGLVALGVYFSFRVINFADMTCDGSFVLGMAISSTLLLHGYHPLIALGAALFFGACAGLITALLATVLHISELLSGIIVACMLYSLNLKIMGGVPNIVLYNVRTLFSENNVFFIIIFLVGVVISISAFLLRTDFGLGLLSVGQNKTMAPHYGISVRKMTFVGLMISNAIIACAGAVISQYQGFADISSGIGTLVIGLAALMIGEKIISSRSPFFIFMGCFIGSILYRLFIALALHSNVLGIQTQDLNLLTGLMMIAVMMLPKGRFACYK